MTTYFTRCHRSCHVLHTRHSDDPALPSSQSLTQRTPPPFAPPTHTQDCFAWPQCAGCGKIVTDNIVAAMNGQWHSECFRCTGCGCEFDERCVCVRVALSRRVRACHHATLHNHRADTPLATERSYVNVDGKPFCRQCAQKPSKKKKAAAAKA